MRFFTILLIVSAIFFTSCAERYSTRKRTAKMEGREDISKNKRNHTEVSQTKSSKKTGKNHQEKAEKEVIEKTPSVSAKKENTSAYTTSEQQQLVLDTALSYLGSPYKYGGTTRKGFDCSGFVSASFKPLDVSLHRSSHEMANQGKNVDLKNVQIGDLLFFVTGKNKRISHVGIVVETGNEIKFIHSSTSRGVIISSLSEGYWSKAYRKAKRILM
ncbi:peptidase [Capnocytophaga stomatis]|uniref:Peptidase n=2 Tax=Capnocytophaga stomatis TaxID=1848904 RepID=A0A250FT55_9FLAO|nr:C40 family peptidase [Capnocytophaga stomatis]ATA88339.1 peptidase [Capnocytophaga stomatis]